MATRTGRIGVAQFARESWPELQKVTWPSRETVIRLTFIVLLISVLIGIYIFVFDNIFTAAITNGILGAPATPAPPPAGP